MVARLSSAGPSRNGRAAGGGGVLQGVAGAALGGVHADGQGVTAMPEPTMPIAACIASVPALQANSQSAAWVWGTAPMASATMRGGRLDRVGMALAADPDRADRLGVDAGAVHGVAGRFDRHRGHVLVQAGDGFLYDRHAAWSRRSTCAISLWPAVGSAARRRRIRRCQPAGLAASGRCLVDRGS